MTYKFSLGQFSSVGALVALITLGRWSPERLFGAPGSIESGFYLRLLLLVILVLGISLRRRWRPTIGLGGVFLVSLPIVYFLLSATWATNVGNPYYLTSKSFEACIILVTLAFLPSAIQTEADLRLLQIMLLFVCGTIVTASFLSSGAFAAANGADPDRLAVFGGGPNILSRLAFTCLAISLILGLDRRNRVYIFLTFFSLIVIILTGSRGGLAATTSIIILWTLNVFPRTIWCSAQRKQMLSRKMFRLVLIGFAISSIIFIVWMLPQFSAVKSIFEHRILQRTFEEGYVAGRDVLFDRAISTWLLHPYFGGGLASFSAGGYLLFYPHNIFLEFLSEGGAFGFAVMAGSILMVCSLIWRDRAYVDKGFLLILVGAVVASQSSGDLYDSRIVFIYEMLCLISIKIAKQTVRKSHTSLPISVSSHGSGIVGYVQKRCN